MQTFATIFQEKTTYNETFTLTNDYIYILCKQYINPFNNHESALYKENLSQNLIRTVLQSTAIETLITSI